MGKVQNIFGNGFAGAVSRSIDDIIISVKNAGNTDIAFGSPVFLVSDGAVGFDTTSPQDFSTFLGFAVRVADKTPDSYPEGQFGDASAGVWHAGDVMEVLVRGSLAAKLAANGDPGDSIYIRKSDGRLTPVAGSSGSTVQLTNVHIRRPRDSYGMNAELTVTERNIL